MPKHTELPETFSPDFLEKLDGRTTLARTVRERYNSLAADLGGHDALSYQRRSLCKRAVWLEALIERQEAALARGEDVNSGALTQQTNALLGLLKTLGLDRVARTVPTVADIVRGGGGK